MTTTTTPETAAPTNHQRELADDLEHRVDSLGALIKQHPLAALGIAFGLGFLIARVVHR